MTSQREKYEAERGADAGQRQVAAAKERFVCCGELKDDGHHPLCRNYVEPEAPAHIEGQASLL